jgi:hypothetical protein
MSTLVSLIFLLSVAAMALVYPMYFFDLSAFGKIMVRDHSALVGQQRLSLADSYKVLQSIKAGRLGDTPLSPEALLVHSRAKRLLYIGAALFMVVLFIGLTDAVLSKHAGRA